MTKTWKKWTKLCLSEKKLNYQASAVIVRKRRKDTSTLGVKKLSRSMDVSQKLNITIAEK